VGQYSALFFDGDQRAPGWTDYELPVHHERAPHIDLQLLLIHLPQVIWMALAFTASLLGILLAHEFGHYLVSRFHKTAASLPYFIPFPLSPLGTMGAVIVQKEAHRNKRILFDIGIAGPLAGLVVAIPVLLLGIITF
jgi:Zn-dependent protease